MKTRSPQILALIAISNFLLLISPHYSSPLNAQEIITTTSNSSRFDPTRISAIKSSSVMFIENMGQFDEGARFQVRGGDGMLWLAEDALWVTRLERPQTESSVKPLAPTPDRLQFTKQDQARKGVNLKLSFVSANPNPTLEPFDRLDTHVSYFIGNDSGKWRTDVPVWSGVRYKDLYPGIDLEITGDDGQLAQRIVAREGANLAAVQLRVDGGNALRLDEAHLRITTAVGEFSMPLFRVMGAAKNKPPHATLVGTNVIAPFSRLTIRQQPFRISSSSALLYATFLGGSAGDWSAGVTVDENGAAYVAGGTSSTDFPTTPGPFDATYNGGSHDVFVAKMDPMGSALTYATFLGGSGDDFGYDIAGEAHGAAYVTGVTTSSDFPTTTGAFDTTYNGNNDTFVVKLNAEGSVLTYATFLGGVDDEHGMSIAVGRDGVAYVTGETASSDFPTTTGAFDTVFSGNAETDTFVVKVNAMGSALTFATYLGGSSRDWGAGIAVGGDGAAYVTGGTSSADFPTTTGAFDTVLNGDEAFVVKLTPTGSALSYSTFLGGTSGDWSAGIAVDGEGAAYVTGTTLCSDFPVTPGAFDTNPVGNGNEDAFVAKLNAMGSALTYATFLGGNDLDNGGGIAVDGNGNAYVVGGTSSSDFPTTPGAFDTTYNGNYDAFAVKLNAQGSALGYATFLGGSGYDSGGGIPVDRDGAAYVTGATIDSPDFPATPGAFDTTYNGYYDAFVVKLAMVAGPPYSIFGRVTTEDGNLSGVTISDNAGHSTTTDGYGNYALIGLEATTYTITPSKNGYTFSPELRNVSVPPGATGQDFVAVSTNVDLGFQTNTNGYKFSNSDLGWGIYPFPPTQFDFTANDMASMFGPDVCQVVVGGVCILKSNAAMWKKEVNYVMNGGHCTGMAATSLRFFKGYDNPSDFQAGASSTHDLDLSNARAHIAYYFIKQITDPIVSYKGQILQNDPKTILEMLRTRMSSGAVDPATIFVRSGGSGHEIVPYAIIDQGNEVYWVNVYDNNHPNDANRHIVIDTKANTWSYDLGWTTWTGNAATHTLGIVPISEYNLSQVCPVCGNNTISKLQPSSSSSQVWLDGKSHLLITNAQGQRIGYLGSEFVNEIPGAFDFPIDRGLGIPHEPIYQVPTGDSYNLMIDGQTLAQPDIESVTQFGPGFAVAVNDVALSPSSQDQLSISPDGTQLVYQVNATKPATLTIAVDTVGVSNQFQVKDADIGAKQSVTIKTDSATGKFAFSNKEAGGGTYDIGITRITSNGAKDFAHNGITIAATDTQYFNYGTWDSTTPMKLEIDHGSDGTIDETLNLSNQACTAKPSKPTITKPKNGGTVKKKKVLLDWEGASCTDNYTVILREGSKTGSKVRTKKNLTVSQFKTKALTSGKTYFWRVMASNNKGITKSAWRSFTVQ